MQISAFQSPKKWFIYINSVTVTEFIEQYGRNLKEYADRTRFYKIPKGSNINQRNKVLEDLLKWQNVIPVIGVNRSNCVKSGNSGVNLIQNTDENVRILIALFYTVEGTHYILRYEAPPPI